MRPGSRGEGSSEKCLSEAIDLACQDQLPLVPETSSEDVICLCLVVVDTELAMS